MESIPRNTRGSDFHRVKREVEDLATILWREKLTTRRKEGSEKNPHPFTTAPENFCYNRNLTIINGKGPALSQMKWGGSRRASFGGLTKE